tara:strand:- start:442 stop:1074 length:633 start_codon:yes stop_codon:yes gene_type:complete
MDFISKEVESYAYDHTQAEGELLSQLEKETHATLEIPQMLTGRIEGRFLRLLAFLIKAKRIIEVGTFSGYSTISMAEALPDDGELFTCDEDPICLAVARKYFSKSPHGKKIRVLEGKAMETLVTLKGLFDMAFIDADKVNYRNYYETILPMIRPGGLIAVDNVLWSGRVLDPKNETDHAINDFNIKITSDNRVDKVMLTVRDGLYCLRKK